MNGVPVLIYVAAGTGVEGVNLVRQHQAGKLNASQVSLTFRILLTEVLINDSEMQQIP